MAKADLSIKLAAPPPPLLYSHFPFLHFDNRLSPFSNESSVFREQSWTGFLDTLGRVGWEATVAIKARKAAVKQRRWRCGQCDTPTGPGRLFVGYFRKSDVVEHCIHRKDFNGLAGKPWGEDLRIYSVRWICSEILSLWVQTLDLCMPWLWDRSTHSTPWVKKCYY